MIDKDRITEEAKHFFEWPAGTKDKDKDTVTLTSCIIFANVMAEMVRVENGEK